MKVKGLQPHISSISSSNTADNPPVLPTFIPSTSPLFLTYLLLFSPVLSTTSFILVMRLTESAQIGLHVGVGGFYQ